MAEQQQYGTSSVVRISFIRFPSKTFQTGTMPQRHFNHISIVVMAFKCHTGLDTCNTTTPGERSYTSLHKKRAPLSFVIQEQSIVISGEQGRAGMSTRKPPKATQSMQSSPSNLHLPFSRLPTSFSWQMIWRGTDHVEPNPSYLAEDHTDGPD